MLIGLSEEWSVGIQPKHRRNNNGRELQLKTGWEDWQ